MNWEIILIISLLIWVLGATLFKSITKKLPQSKALSVIFFLCAIIMLGYNLIFKTFQFEQAFLLISVVGFINAYGSYCQLRAYKYSLSKTSLFLPLSGLITVGLAALFLGESTIYNFKVLIGVLLLFVATFLLSVKKGRVKKEKIGKEWLLFTLGMVLIWGMAFFMVKFFSFSIPKETFLLYWYIGAFFSSLSIIGLGRIIKIEEKTENRLIQKGFWRIPLASLAILGSLATTYWVFQLAPAGAVEPIRRFGMGFLPILIGWFGFKEKKELTKIQLLGFISGIAGISLVILGIY